VQMMTIVAEVRRGTTDAPSLRTVICLNSWRKRDNTGALLPPT
jgi:hypothetical protein